MPMHAASYFAGIGTVIATMALGFGGGVMMTDAFVGKSDSPPSLMDRRAASASEASPPNLDPAAAALPVAAASRPETPSSQLQPQPAPVLASTPAAPSLAAQPRQPNDAIAAARDIDVKRSVAAERRKDARRKWAERRRQELKKIDELHAVAERVKQAEREPVTRSFVAESPAIRLFGDD